MSEAKPTIARYEGPRGEVVEVFDLTHQYAYKNIHLVKLLVEATFTDTDEKFTRLIEKMGVYDEELQQTKDELVKSFEKTGLPYIFKAGFSARLAEQRRQEAAKKARGPIGYGN